MKTIVHVNKHVIRKNRVAGEDNPPLKIKTYQSNEPAREAVVVDAAGKEVGRFVYRPKTPLSCGAEVWFETQSPYRVVPAETPTEEVECLTSHKVLSLPVSSPGN